MGAAGQSGGAQLNGGVGGPGISSNITGCSITFLVVEKTLEMQDLL
jgi:hypothetical protein